MRNELALATLDACRRHGVEADAAAVAALILRSEIAKNAPGMILRRDSPLHRWAEAAAKDHERLSWEIT